MAIQARVTSTEALDTFRAKLIIFINKARQNIDDVTDEVRRTRSWLQHDQMMRWEGEIRRRTKKLQQAQSELQNVKLMSNQQSAAMSREAAVNRAKGELAEAEDKLRRIKKWNLNYDNCSDPVIKRLEGLRQFVTDEMPKGVAYLRNVQKALEAYNEDAAPSSDTVAAPAPAPQTETGQDAAPANQDAEPTPTSSPAT